MATQNKPSYGRLQTGLKAYQNDWIPFMLYVSGTDVDSLVHLSRWNPEAKQFECWDVDSRRWLQRAQGRAITQAQATTLLQGATFPDPT